MSPPLIGFIISDNIDINIALDIIKNELNTFIALPLARSAECSLSTGIKGDMPQIVPYFDSISELSSKKIYSKIVGIINSCANPKEFSRELEWASYLGPKAIIVKTPPDLASPEFPHFANALATYFYSVPHSTVWLKMSVFDDMKIWQSLQKFCGQSRNIALLLSFSPSKTEPLEYICNFWKDNLAKLFRLLPVSAILISSASLHRDEKGHLTFGQLDDVIKHYAQSNTNILITSDESQNILQNDSLLRDTISTLNSLISNKTGVNIDYWDLPQYPLQPLRDNLQFQCYENFETSQSKYYSYFIALKKYVSLQVSKSGDVLFILAGSGRGPLIRSIIEAQKAVLGEIKYWTLAVDKNEFSIVSLKSRSKILNWEKVRALTADMRDLSFVNAIKEIVEDKKYDLCVVSELLGSAGDNELAPECLNGLYKSLVAEKITETCSVTFIPCDCLNYWEPIQSFKIYQNLNKLALTNPAIFDSPSVICLNSIFRPSEIAPGFKFDFPPKTEDDLSRYVALDFVFNATCEIHGFAGYFVSDLYDDYFISILPGKRVQDSHDAAWFPLFLPIDSPLLVKKGDKITLHLWRKQNTTSVWYEWAVANPIMSRLYNSQGKSWSVSKCI